MPRYEKNGQLFLFDPEGDEETELVKLAGWYLGEMKQGSHTSVRDLVNGLLVFLEGEINRRNAAFPDEEAWKFVSRFRRSGIPDEMGATILTGLFDFANVRTEEGDFFRCYQPDGDSAGTYVHPKNVIRFGSIPCFITTGSRKKEHMLNLISENAPHISLPYDQRLAVMNNGYLDVEAQEFHGFTPEVPFMRKMAVNYDPGMVYRNMYVYLKGCPKEETEEALRLSDGSRDAEGNILMGLGYVYEEKSGKVFWSPDALMKSLTEDQEEDLWRTLASLPMVYDRFKHCVFLHGCPNDKEYPITKGTGMPLFAKLIHQIVYGASPGMDFSFIQFEREDYTYSISSGGPFIGMDRHDDYSYPLPERFKQAVMGAALPYKVSRDKKSTKCALHFRGLIVQEVLSVVSEREKTDPFLKDQVHIQFRQLNDWEKKHVADMEKCMTDPYVAGYLMNRAIWLHKQYVMI